MLRRAVCLAPRLLARGREERRRLSSFPYDASKIVNCAIIAHVDHGKTTLMDKLLQFCGATLTGERAMDSNDQEKERGITITSKYTRLRYKDRVLHIVDTPGHADFGGEVERILSMVDGVVLLVDATEGPMSQTKFVLSKAIALNKKAVVVLNKVDREGHRAQEVETEIFDLFCALTSSDALLEYPLLYASARQGWVAESLGAVPGKDVTPLLEAIIQRFPPAATAGMIDLPFAMNVNTISTDNHLGRIVTGKVEAGQVSMGDTIKVLLPLLSLLTLLTARSRCWPQTEPPRRRTSRSPSSSTSRGSTAWTWSAATRGRSYRWRAR